MKHGTRQKLTKKQQRKAAVEDVEYMIVNWPQELTPEHEGDSILNEPCALNPRDTYAVVYPNQEVLYRLTNIDKEY